ncbi:MAG: hypothetical protein WC309_02755 [Candidatus Paceibacterota bacterium]|jgi:DNA-binding CsgD family transcriptional regulator|nr:hypothetical protein [Candidatus Omnitrophota bacterium]MDD5551532.1 hypothetical protein [Candidatus Omnitrophota bacterium]
MPTVNPDTIESIEITEDIVKEYIPDPLKQFWFFRALQKSLHFDENGRVHGFNQHIIHYRRKYVIDMYNSGKNYEEIAKSLKVSVSLIRHDIDWYTENKRNKKIPLSTTR